MAVAPPNRHTRIKTLIRRLGVDPKQVIEGSLSEAGFEYLLAGRTPRQTMAIKWPAGWELRVRAALRLDRDDAYVITDDEQFRREANQTVTDAELVAMGLPPADEIRRVFARSELVGAVLEAAGLRVNGRYDPRVPLLAQELAEQLVDLKTWSD